MLAVRRLRPLIGCRLHGGGYRHISDVGVVSGIKAGMESLQMSTGLPWFMVFCLGGTAVRVGLFPLAIRRTKINLKLQKSLPELNALYKMLVRRLNMIPPTHVEERFKVMSIYFKGVRSSLALHEASVLGMVTYTAATVACFVTFFYSLRSMIADERGAREGSPTTGGGKSRGLRSGGFLWVKDLTRVDPYYVLPSLGVACTYASLEMSFQAAEGLKASRRLTFPTRVKGFLQGAFILGFPFILNLPAGVFCYWIPGTFVAVAQARLLRSPAFLKWIKR